MNVVDVILLLIIAWQGVSGGFYGVKVKAIGFAGTIAGIFIAGRLHRSVALTVQPAISRFIPENENIPVNVSGAVNMGVREEVIDKWFYINENQSDIIAVMGNGVQAQDIYQAIFVVLNLIAFILVFLIINYFNGILIHSRTVDTGIHKHADYFQGNLSNPGLFIGFVQGIILSGLFVFVVTVIGSLGFESWLNEELYNSKIAAFLIDLITRLL